MSIAPEDIIAEAHAAAPLATLTLEPQNTQAIATATAGWESTAQALVVVNEDTKAEALRVRRGIKGLIKQIQADYKPITQALEAAKKTALAKMNGHLTPLEKADNILRVKIETWDRAVEEAERKRQEALAKKLEEERAATQAEADLLSAVFADAQAPQGGALAVQAPSETEVALAVLDIDAEARKSAARAEGAYYATTTQMEVRSLEELVKAVAEGKAPLAALKADEVWLRSQIKHYDPETFALKFPGVVYTLVKALRQRS